jgi:large subunit ribosomal protein L24
MKIWKRIKQNVKHKKLHVVRGDKVQIVAGKEKGKTGQVVRVLRKTGRVIVEKANMVKKHAKASGPQSPGGIIEKEASIHLSNVQVYCEKCNTGVRISRKVLADGAIVRSCKKCDTHFKGAAK